MIQIFFLKLRVFPHNVEFVIVFSCELFASNSLTESILTGKSFFKLIFHESDKKTGFKVILFNHEIFYVTTLTE